MTKIHLLIYICLVQRLYKTNTIFYGKLTKGNISDVNVLSPIRNQNQPYQCGASWAFAITSSMADQFNAIKSTEFPEVVLSPQMLLTCRSTTINKTCAYSNSVADADITQTLDNIIEFGVSRETCNIWHSNDTEKCDAQAQCKDCTHGEDIHGNPNCSARSFHSFKLKKYENISQKNGELSDLEEIRAKLIKALNDNGPVVCNINHNGNIFEWRVNQPDVYDETGTLMDYTTWVSVVGYIEFPKNNEKTIKIEHLWVVRLSFGDSIGHFGYIYLNADEGSNDLNILNNCFTLEVDQKIMLHTNSNQSFLKLFVKTTDFGIDITKSGYLHKKSTLAIADSGLNHKQSVDDPLETPIFWGNHEGRNYLTWIRNQHLPGYCGSCWAQAGISCISDRVNIMQINQNRGFPRHVFSVQSVINCILGGTCYGGDPGLLFLKAKNWKIPTDSCQVYKSQNPQNYNCEEESRCYNSSKDNSWVIRDFNGVTIDDWEDIQGPEAIKIALQQGPIVCGLETTPQFVHFHAGIDLREIQVFEQKKKNFDINHAVSIVGWDRDDEGDYWIVRNSWGVEFAYGGYFYIRTGNILGMEASCQVPKSIIFTSWKNS